MRRTRFTSEYTTIEFRISTESLTAGKFGELPHIPCCGTLCIGITAVADIDTGDNNLIHTRIHRVIPAFNHSHKAVQLAAAAH